MTRGDEPTAGTPARSTAGAGGLARGLQVVGLVVLAAGVLLGVDRAVDLPVRLGAVLAGWWPAAIAAVGVWRLARRRAGGWVVTVFGLVLLAATTGAIARAVAALPDPDLLLPLGLIALGLAVFVGGLTRWRWSRSRTAVFGDVHVRAEPGRARDDVMAVFGDAELVVDADRADAAGPLAATAVFGDAEVVVPVDAAVTVRELAIFGEVTAPAPPTEATSHLVVDATAVFGDVEVRRRS